MGLQDIDNELERGVFIAVYNSKKQRRRRILVGLLLGLKHGLRGILFSWPLYVLPFSTFALPEQYRFLFILFLLPGLYLSGLILKKGVEEDYVEFVSDRILFDGYSKKMLFIKK